MKKQTNMVRLYEEWCVATSASANDKCLLYVAINDKIHLV